MEGIAVMILYLVIGFFKNRKDKIKRKKIKADPDWDSEKKIEPDISLNKILNNILDNGLEDYGNINNQNKTTEILEVKKKPSEPELENKLKSNLNKINLDKDQKEKRKSLRNNVKKEKKKSKLKFIKDVESLKKAIILKEILDKPLVMRKKF